VRYLSPEWMDAVRQALAGDVELQAATAGMTLTIEQVVADGPAGTVRWHLVIDGGQVALVDGPAERPDLRFSAAYATACQIASGDLGAQRAFVEGRLRVGGDLSVLLRHQRTLASVDDALAKVRAETTFD
jgi:hypothetical protein